MKYVLESSKKTIKSVESKVFAISMKEDDKGHYYVEYTNNVTEKTTLSRFRDYSTASIVFEELIGSHENVGH